MPEARLLREVVRRCYLELAPVHSPAMDFLMDRLSAVLYRAGVRVSIGTEPVHTLVDIHHSLDADQKLVWTSKSWNQIMQWRSQAAIGMHVRDFITEDSYEFLRDVGWPVLLREGKVTGQVTLVARDGTQLPATARVEVMRDSAGQFERTFARNKVRILQALVASLFILGIAP